MRDLLSALQFFAATVLGRLQVTLFNQLHPLPIVEETAIFAFWQAIMVMLAVYHQELLKLFPGAWMERRRRKLAISEQKAAKGKLGKIRPRWQLLVFTGTTLLPLGLLTLALVIVWQWPRKRAIALFATANTATFLLYRYVGSFLPLPHVSTTLLIGIGALVVAIYLWRRLAARRKATLTEDLSSDQPLPNPLLEPLPQ